MNSTMEPATVVAPTVRLDAAVVIPVRNRPEMLRTCLTCLVAQSFDKSRFEVIVCDDGSTDDLAPIVAEMRDAGLQIIHVRQPPRGPAAARNLGIRSASAPIVVFIDSDVEVEPQLVEQLVSTLQRSPECAGTVAKLVPCRGEQSPLWCAPRNLEGGSYHTAAIAYRRGILEAVGGLDEEFTKALCEDLELAAQVRTFGDIQFVPSAIAYHPRRRETVGYRWFVSHAWRYAVIVGLRYGVIGHEFTPTRYPRLRLAYAAAILVPAGRFLYGMQWVRRSPGIGVRACFLAICDGVFGLLSLPSIVFTQPPVRRKYVGMGAAVPAHR